jgi:hypothetical protein
MKHILLAAVFLFSFSKIQSQVFGGPEVFNENFNSGIPAGWTIIDVDGNTQIPFCANQGYTGQWQYFHHPGKNCVAVGTTGGTPNDYLISPAITLAAGQYVLSWRACSSSEFTFQDYEMRISTTTPDVAGMLANPPVAVVTSENFLWTEHQANISTYAGQTVYIGLRASNGNWVMFADDIRISSPVSYDAAITSLDFPEVVLPGTYTMTGEIWNAGVFPISSYTLNWNVNNGPVNSIAQSSVNIPTGTKQNFSSLVTFNPSASGTYYLKVWASALNSNADVYHGNDTLTRAIFVSTFPKKLLVEEFTQAGCMPCAAINPFFDAVVFPNLTAQKIAAIKYHSSWPGVDQMYLDNIAMSENRVFYYDVSGVPEAVVDGAYIPNYNATYLGDPGGFTQTRVDSALAYPAIYEIAVTNSTIGSTNYVSVTVTAKVDVPMNNMHLYTVIIEDSVNYSGSNGESVFYQVARQILPANTGQLLPVMNASQSVTYNFSYPVTSVYDPSLLRSVAFVTDDETRKTYQAEVAAPYPNPAGVNESAIKYELNVFPNPAQNQITISANGINGNEISWSLVNMMGEIVLEGKDAVSKQFTKQFDIATLPAGIYFFRINDGSETAVKKIIKN